MPLSVWHACHAMQVAEIRERIETDQRLLIQFAEEKVQLACQGYDLLDTHLGQLDVDMAALAEELQVGGVVSCVGLGGGERGVGEQEEEWGRRKRDRAECGQVRSTSTCQSPACLLPW